MLDRVNRMIVAAMLGTFGAAVLLAPAIFRFELPSAGATSSSLIGVVMMLAAVGIGYGNLSLWSAISLGGGAWTLIAPVAFGFYDGGEAFWTHMVAGLAWMLAGLAGHELLARQSQAVRRS